MKQFVKQAWGIFAAALLITGLAGCSAGNQGSGEAKTEESGAETVSQDAGESETTPEVKSMNLWYTDSNMSAYFEEAAAAYGKDAQITVTASQVSAIDYLEGINQNNIEKEDIVDVYIINSESLEKAYMAGLAYELPENTSGAFPDIAKSACMYQGNNVGYPVYFETAFFLYHKNIDENPPANFQAIMDFAASDFMTEENAALYENMQTFLKWDVLNLFYNYSFVGDGLNLGGANRDDRTIVDINNEQVIKALTFYKQLNQSLYFDASEVEYHQLIQDFLEGKILYTIGGTESLRVLEASEADYGIAVIPPLTEGVNSQGISTNYVAVVNPYANDLEAAEALARFVSDGYAANCYSLSGKLPSKRLDSYPVEEFVHVMEAYEASAQMPKLMDTTNFWVELEVVMNNIWKAEMDEEEAEAGLTDSSQAEDTGAAELKKQQMEAQIRELVTEELAKVQTQMEVQLQ